MLIIQHLIEIIPGMTMATEEESTACQSMSDMAPGDRVPKIDGDRSTRDDTSRHDGRSYHVECEFEDTEIGDRLLEYEAIKAIGETIRGFESKPRRA